MTSSTEAQSRPTVFMMDLLAIVPYYTAYLSRALLAAGISVTVGSIPYYLDPDCFRSRGVPLASGLLHTAALRGLPRALRRVLKLVEGTVNLFTVAVRFLFRPPQILHVQFLPLLHWHLPLELWFLRFCGWRGIKVVLTVHDILPHDTGERFRGTYQKLYLGMDTLICHSAEVHARLTTEFSIALEKISVIPHGPSFTIFQLQNPTTLSRVPPKNAWSYGREFFSPTRASISCSRHGAKSSFPPSARG